MFNTDTLLFPSETYYMFIHPRAHYCKDVKTRDALAPAPVIHPEWLSHDILPLLNYVELSLCTGLHYCLHYIVLNPILHKYSVLSTKYLPQYMQSGPD